jgi:3-deoxy-D-manno-octulosonic-acid transferase
MKLFGYDLLMRALQPVVRRKLKRRAVHEPLYAQHMGQRFGVYDTAPQSVDIWIHAVSLGETRAAQLLIKALRALRPDLKLLLTHGTATGWAQGAQSLRAGDVQAWLPWDTASAVSGFLDHFHPRLGVLMETEVWPQLVSQCQQRGIGLVLANARLSDKSLRQALRLGGLARHAYQGLSQVWSQTSEDAQRLSRLGVQHLQVMGNLKYDQQPDASQLALARSWRAELTRPVLLLASSREGEELTWMQALKSQAGDGAAGGAAGVLPWVVPRHPQRFDEVAQALSEQGWKVCRRSQLSFDADTYRALNQPGVVVLGDSMGEMALYYGLATVALMGGSFERFGGQNLIEALACGCPVVLGPHTYNFAQASSAALQAGAALQATDMAHGVGLALQLCADPGRTKRMADLGQQMVQSHQGVAERMAQQLLALLDAPINSTRR